MPASLPRRRAVPTGEGKAFLEEPLGERITLLEGQVEQEMKVVVADAPKVAGRLDSATDISPQLPGVVEVEVLVAVPTFMSATTTPCLELSTPAAYFGKVGCVRQVGHASPGVAWPGVGFLGRLAAGWGRSGRRSNNHANRSRGFLPKKRSAAVVPSARCVW